MNTERVTAAILVIGDEILSGRTQDTNTAYIAKFLGALGIDLCEARVVPDIRREIIDALNALRSRYTYVFTTGGIGPTHDDITFESVAEAFGVGVHYHPEAIAMMEARYKPGEFNEARRRMALIPVGAELVRNTVSTAPGVHIGNVFVMAGIPMIMRAMLDAVAPRLRRGAVVHAATVQARVTEGRIAQELERIQKAHADVAIGSYPYYRDDGAGVQLVARGRDAGEVECVAGEIEAMLRGLDVEPTRVTQ